jgi:hypothetical protein
MASKGTRMKSRKHLGLQFSIRVQPDPVLEPKYAIGEGKMRHNKSIQAKLSNKFLSLGVRFITLLQF